MNPKTYFIIIFITAIVTAGIFWIVTSTIPDISVNVVVFGTILSFTAIVLAAFAEYKLYH